MTETEMTIEQREGFVAGLKTAYESASAVYRAKKESGAEIEASEASALTQQYSDLILAEQNLLTRKRARKLSVYRRF